MTEIDLRDYVAAGYFITKLSKYGFTPTPYFQHEQVISLSSCINPWFIEPLWGGNIEKHKLEILWWGIAETKFDALREYSSQMFGKDHHFPNVFLKLSSAQRFIKRFLSNLDDVILLGVGLPKDVVMDFLPENSEPVSDANKQDKRQALLGVGLVLSQNEVLKPGGEIMGFEVVSFPYNNFGHSWLCSNLQTDMYELFDINTGKFGLLRTYEDAMKVYEWIAEDKMQGTRAEPEPYYPWLIVQYPVN